MPEYDIEAEYAESVAKIFEAEYNDIENEIAEALSQDLTAEIDQEILRSLRKEFPVTIDDIIFSPVGRSDDPDRVMAGFSPDRPDPLQATSVNCSRLLACLEEALAPALESFLFELNNTHTRRNVQAVISGIVAEIPGVSNYRVICDETNNGVQVIADHALNVDIWVQPPDVLEYVYFRGSLG